MRPRTKRIQLVRRSALSQVPVPGPSEVAGKTQAELLPCEYFHIVFTLPAPLATLALQNKRQMYDLLFRATAETLQSIAADPKRLGVQIGFFCPSQLGTETHHEPSLMMPGITVSFVFNEQRRR